MRPWEIIHALKQTSGKNAKLEILSKIPADNDLWAGVKWANDYLITFGVKKLPVPNKHGDGVEFSTFEKLATALSRRELTGKKALEVIQAFAEKCTQAQWEWWYRRILEKKLDCGVDTGFNKYAPEEFKVKPFAGQLAKPLKDAKPKHFAKNSRAEAKYDGERGFWFITKETQEPDEEDIFDTGEPKTKAVVRCFSRNGNEYLNYGSIAEQLAKLVDFPGFPDGGLVLDSEVMVLASKEEHDENRRAGFQALTSQARRKSNVDFNGMAMLFDVIPLDIFQNQGETAPLRDRLEVLEMLVDWLRKKVVPDKALFDISYGIELDMTSDEGQKEMNRFFLEQVEAGWEGLVIKDLDASYQYGRTYHWLKVKPQETYDLTVVGIQPGTGARAGGIGALICEGDVEDGDTVKHIKVEVGSGLKKEDVEADPKTFIGKTIEVSADGISRNKAGGYSLSFPVYKRIRTDK